MAINLCKVGIGNISLQSVEQWFQNFEIKCLEVFLTLTIDTMIIDCNYYDVM